MQLISTHFVVDFHGRVVLPKIIVFPRCAFCGAEDPYPCRVCGTMTCLECIILLTEDVCEHGAYEKVEGNEWKLSSDEAST